MNRTNSLAWPLIGEHPSWCVGLWCHQTALGYEHASQPRTMTLGDQRWQVTLHRADEPTPGEAHLSIVVTDAASYGAGIQHVLTVADTQALIKLLAEQVTEACSDNPVELVMSR